MRVDTPSTICDFHIYLCAENGVKVNPTASLPLAMEVAEYFK